ncbi:MAG: hypothetical protein GHCLOJNM_03644 [bacterium]|nr:hypothetical protein [bacterium]
MAQSEYPLESGAGLLQRKWDELSAIRKRAGTPERFYEHEVFPLLRNIHQQEAKNRPTAKILFVTIGTQPYSPALALTATPHERAILLYSSETEFLVPKVLVLHGESIGNTEKAFIGDGTESVKVMDVIHSYYIVAGEPPPHSVVVDVTSGRKATAAALGAIAAARDFRQVYLEGQAHPVHKHLIFTTRYVQLPSALLLCGQDLRNQAVALIAAGAWNSAARTLKSILDKGFAGPKDLQCFLSLKVVDALATAGYGVALSQLRKLLRTEGGADPHKNLAHGKTLLSSPKGRMAVLATLGETARRSGQRELAALCAITMAVGQRRPASPRLFRIFLSNLPDDLTKEAVCFVHALLHILDSYEH